MVEAALELTGARFGLFLPAGSERATVTVRRPRPAGLRRPPAVGRAPVLAGALLSGQSSASTTSPSGPGGGDGPQLRRPGRRPAGAELAGAAGPRPRRRRPRRPLPRAPPGPRLRRPPRTAAGGLVLTPRRRRRPLHAVRRADPGRHRPVGEPPAAVAARHPGVAPPPATGPAARHRPAGNLVAATSTTSSRCGRRPLRPPAGRRKRGGAGGRRPHRRGPLHGAGGGAPDEAPCGVFSRLNEALLRLGPTGSSPPSTPRSNRRCDGVVPVASAAAAIRPGWCYGTTSRSRSSTGPPGCSSVCSRRRAVDIRWLSPGDALVLVTDGVLEARDDHGNSSASSASPTCCRPVPAVRRQGSPAGSSAASSTTGANGPTTTSPSSSSGRRCNTSPPRPYCGPEREGCRMAGTADGDTTQWVKVDPGELARTGDDGGGRRSGPVPHPHRRRGTARSTTAARTRAARSARARSRTAAASARGTATTTTRSPARRPRGFADAATALPGRGARRRRLRRAAGRPHERDRRSGRDGRDAGATGASTHVFGMVGPLQPRLADALRRPRRPAGSRYVGIRHEGAAAFAAVRLRQAHRPARGVLRDRRPGRHQPAHRPVRRQGRPRAGARAHRPGAVEGARAGRVPGARPRRRRSPPSPVEPDGAADPTTRELMALAVQARASCSATSPTSCFPTRCRCSPALDEPAGPAPRGPRRRRRRSRRRQAELDRAVALLGAARAAGDHRRPRRAASA